MREAKATKEIKVSVENINYFNDLVKRDKAMPVKVYEFRTFKGSLEECAECGGYIFKGYKFCPHCGQRIDWENVAL